MADTSWNLGAQYDGASGTDANASAVNAGQMALLTNKSGGDLVTGDVVVQLATTDASVTTTTTAGDLRPVFVVPQNVTGANVAASKTVTADEAGWFYKPGAVVPAANVDGAVDIGEYLTTSTTAKKLTGSGVTIGASTSRPLGACAVALEDATGAGTIKILLLGTTESFGIADKTEKTTVAGDDLVIIADSAASNILKSAKIKNIKSLPYTYVTRAASQSIDGGAKVSFTAEVVTAGSIQLGAWVVGAPTRLTAPVTGLYYLNARGTLSGSGLSAFYKNGSAFAPEFQAPDPTLKEADMSGLVVLAAKDYIEYHASFAGGNITNAHAFMVLLSGGV